MFTHNFVFSESSAISLWEANGNPNAVAAAAYVAAAPIPGLSVTRIVWANFPAGKPIYIDLSNGSMIIGIGPSGSYDYPGMVTISSYS